jgi:hypothetical protein
MTLNLLHLQRLLRHSLARGSGPPQPQPTHSAHYADANEPEIAVSEHFIRTIESAFGPETHIPPEFAAAFADFLFEATKLEQLVDRGPIFEIANLDFPVSNLLAHLSLQC